MQMAWLSGHSLSQTVFTCMYFHDVFSLVQEKIEPSQRIDQPPELVSSVLKAYVLATTKCCHLVWREMVSGNVYEVCGVVDMRNYR
jgi:N-alpha-acetyltransferase 35, NatC auxiliary subunit